MRCELMNVVIERTSILTSYFFNPCTGSMEIANNLSHTLSIEVNPTVAFDHPSISAITAYIVDEHSVIASPKDSLSIQKQDLIWEKSIVIRAMSGKLPGVDGYCLDPASSIFSEKDCVSQVPYERWDIESGFDPLSSAAGGSYTRFAAFCTDVFEFDHEVFKISYQEACWIDPQVRILLEEHAKVMFETGASPNTGIYIGCMYHEYITNLPDGGAKPPPHAIIGNGASYMAGRVSYTFGLYGGLFVSIIVYSCDPIMLHSIILKTFLISWHAGPSICSDTACSSSLVACHLSGNSLMTQGPSANFASGVNLLLNSDTFSAICHLKALSFTGRCQTFSQNAEGYGRAEGSIVLLMESIDKGAMNDKDIVAYVHSICMNQDGRSSSLTAPNGSAQVKLLKSACDHAAISPSQVTAVSTHGTGTALGDPIEVSALLKVFAKATIFTLLASKSFLGHAEGNAGLNGVLCGLSLLKGLMKPLVQHLRGLNQFISQSMAESESSYHINKQKSGVSTDPGLVGTSSFGMSGINAHALLSYAHEIGPHDRRGLHMQHVGSTFLHMYIL